MCLRHPGARRHQRLQEAPNGVHQHAAPGAGEGIPLQQIPLQAPPGGDRGSSRPDRAASQGLVPEPPHEAEEAGAGGAGSPPGSPGEPPLSPAWASVLRPAPPSGPAPLSLPLTCGRVAEHRQGKLLPAPSAAVRLRLGAPGRAQPAAVGERWGVPGAPSCRPLLRLFRGKGAARGGGTAGGRARLLAALLQEPGEPRRGRAERGGLPLTATERMRAGTKRGAEPP